MDSVLGAGEGRKGKQIVSAEGMAGRQVNPVITKALTKVFGFKFPQAPLDSRESAVASEDPQASVDDRAVETQEFGGLVKEIGEGKCEPGMWWRFLTRIGCWLSGGNYNLEFARESFKKLENQDGFLEAAFLSLGLKENRENTVENTKMLLELCRGNLSEEQFGVVAGKIKNLCDVREIDSSIELLSKLIDECKAQGRGLNEEIRDQFREVLGVIVDAVALDESKQGKDLYARLEKLHYLCDNCKALGITLGKREGDASALEKCVDEMLYREFLNYFIPDAENEIDAPSDFAMEMLILLRYPEAYADPEKTQLWREFQVAKGSDRVKEALIECFQTGKRHIETLRVLISDVSKLISHKVDGKDIDAKKVRAALMQYGDSVLPGFREIASELLPTYSSILEYLFSYKRGEPFKAFVEKLGSKDISDQEGKFLRKIQGIKMPEDVTQIYRSF